jgi:hypothetical protein
VPDAASLGPRALDALEEAFHDELKAAFAAFCNDLSSTGRPEDAAGRYGGHVNVIKMAHERALAITKTEFGS